MFRGAALVDKTILNVCSQSERSGQKSDLFDFLFPAKTAQIQEQ
jgi:hypothetical protein